MPRRPLAVGVLLALFALLARPTAAQAQTTACPVMDGAAPALAAIDPYTRLRYLHDRLRDDGRHARAWTTAWVLGFTGLAAGGVVLTGLAAADGNRDEVIDQTVGAAASLVGVGFTLVSSLPVADDALALEARIAAGTAAPCAVLAEAERMVLRDAAAEAAGRAWYVHALGIAFNTGLGLTLGLALGHWRNGIVDFTVGTALSEIQVLTLPGGAVDTLARYRAGDLGARGGQTRVTWSLRPLWTAGAAGLSLTGTF